MGEGMLIIMSISREFMIAPHHAPSFKEGNPDGRGNLSCTEKHPQRKGYFTGVGDEGGFAPNLRSNEEAVEVIPEAITTAGYRPGKISPYVSIRLPVKCGRTAGMFSSNPQRKR
ncbi:hypothetical protein ACQ86N_02315 [Puia sp. P3]|uniref:hypothetical protein n=1 Tax=Puia sp. P3 TaxID=3423952 RepID=UPI003D67FFFC